MSYLQQVNIETATDAQKEAAAYHEQYQGKMTNMKRTLLQNVPSFKAYMEWYTLRDEEARFLSNREISLFAYAISTTNDCLVCSTFFRRILIEDGEDPDHLVLGDKEQLLWDFGQAISNDPHHIPEEIYQQLKHIFQENEIVVLMAFAGLMVATNVFVMIAKVDLDEVLYAYRKKDE